MISAALQRRVWIGPTHAPIYPNLYIILVGEPGVGKGIVIKPIAEILKYHKMPDPSMVKQINNAFTAADKAVMEEVMQDDYKLAQEVEVGLGQQATKDKDKRIFEKPLLIPVAADATTYEALVKALSKSIKRCNYKKWDEKLQRDVMAIYTHSSLCFCLEEISSLFRKKTEDVVHLLIQAYDCGDYVYDTKTQGKDRIKSCCLNFFGGTTPGFMQSTFNDQLLTEGYASRTLFIFEAKNRKTKLWMDDLTTEQHQAYLDLVAHVEKLTRLFGRVKISKEDMDWLEDWWKQSQVKRPNTNMRLNPYYARKQLHTIKLATAVHFAESTEMEIKRESFVKAMELLAEAEQKMHYALGLDNANPLSIPARKVLKFIETNGRQTRKNLLVEFWDALPGRDQDLDAIIDYLGATGKIKPTDEKINGSEIIYWDVMRESTI